MLKVGDKVEITEHSNQKYAGEHGEIIHVGRVVKLCEGITSESQEIPCVVSKWGPISGEAMHFARDVPYAKQGYRFRIEYWTDRPKLKPS